MGFQLTEIQSNGCFPGIYISQIRVRIKNQKLHTREAWICDSSMLRNSKKNTVIEKNILPNGDSMVNLLW